MKYRLILTKRMVGGRWGYRSYADSSHHGGRSGGLTWGKGVVLGGENDVNKPGDERVCGSGNGSKRAQRWVCEVWRGCY